MKDRKHFLLAIRDAVGGPPESADEQNAAIEALLLTAATIANAMSPNSIDFATSHVEEAATAMIEILDETFGIAEQLTG